jgi:hypothetical protein
LDVEESMVRFFDSDLPERFSYLFHARPGNSYLASTCLIHGVWLVLPVSLEPLAA